MQQAHVFISGNVQGIGYRQFVKSNAKKLGLTGWVQNLPAGRQVPSNGGVEAVFCGDKDTIEQMIEMCKKGPFLAEVKHLGFEWEDVEQFSSFEIH
jgi:acylphosphatase